MLSASTSPKSLPLDALHRSLGAKMVPFAGYAMPIRYPAGTIAEHQATRTQAGLFDVSHMGQVRLHGADAAAALETLVPGDVSALDTGQMRYTMFTNDHGGILDDLVVVREDRGLLVVVNAARKEADLAHMRSRIGERCEIEVIEDRALIALQGPRAASVMARYAPAARHMMFMRHTNLRVHDIPVSITRSGYTGEDGYELSLPVERVEEFARLLLDEAEVEPVGLGARDSLRLEAGLCLYGSDLDEATTPVEAGLTWTISKRRRAEGGFPGDATIARQINEGASRRRTGLRLEGRAPARAGAEIVTRDGKVIGRVTSGGFGPTAGGPIAMGYVETGRVSTDDEVSVMVRGKALAARITAPTIVPHRYHTI